MDRTGILSPKGKYAKNSSMKTALSLSKTSTSAKETDSKSSSANKKSGTASRIASVTSPKSSVSSAQSPAESTPHKFRVSQKSRKGHSRIFYFWSSEDVVKWLRKHCGQYHQLYAETFLEHQITGRTLMRLTDWKLQSMGITDAQHREELMRHILRLRLKVEAQELKNINHKPATLTIDAAK